MKRIALVAVLALTVTGCLKSARLYDMESAQVTEAHFKTGMGNTGPAWIGETRKTATCRGEFSVVAGGSLSWGTIYSGGTPTTGIGVSTANAQQGVVMMTCGDGRMIECEFLLSADTNTGHGACRDNREHHYKLMF